MIYVLILYMIEWYNLLWFAFKVIWFYNLLANECDCIVNRWQHSISDLYKYKSLLVYVCCIYIKSLKTVYFWLCTISGFNNSLIIIWWTLWSTGLSSKSFCWPLIWCYVHILSQLVTWGRNTLANSLTRLESYILMHIQTLVKTVASLCGVLWPGMANDMYM